MKLASYTALSALSLSFTLATSASPQCQSAQSDVSGTEQVALGAMAANDIVDIASGSGSFTTLVAALKAADLVGVLKGDGPFTVFAPTDEAFAKLPKKQIDMLLKPENKALLSAILAYHVVPGQLMSTQVVSTNNAASVNGQQVAFGMDAGGVTVNGATIVQADIEATNGVIHVIDEVILPSMNDIVTTAVEAGSFKTLAAALDAAALISALQGEGEFTVFAPTDEAFAKLPKGTVASLLKHENRDQLAAILKYHVVPGRVYARDAIVAQRAGSLEGSTIRFDINGEGQLTVNGANIIATDIDCTNGVIHVIDAVILP